MTNNVEINRDYRDWIITTATAFLKSTMECYGITDYSDYYGLLLNKLYDTEFYSEIEKDENRKSDAFGLRFRFSDTTAKYNYREVYNYLVSPINLLEIMLSMAIRIDEEIMGDPRYDSNAFMWFYSMLESSKLIKFADFNYEESEVESQILTVLNRTYSPDGEGGLFTIHEAKKDLRKVELWYQMLWYLDEVIK